MTTGMALLDLWSERWAWMLVHSLWLDGLMALGLWMALRLLPVRQAQQRHAAALVAFGLTLFAPVATWVWLSGAAAVPLPKDATKPAALAAIGAATSPVEPRLTSMANVGPSEHPAEQASGGGATNAADERSPGGSLPNTAPTGRWRAMFLPAMLSVWALGATLQLIRMARDLSSTRALLRGEPPRDPALAASLARVVAMLGLQRRFQVLIGDAGAGPFVFGLWKPTLVLPAALLTGLTPDQLEAVLLHELEHLRRYDDVVNFVQLLAESVFFFNPALRWISRELGRERESSCDARAAACLRSPIPLAEALVRSAAGWGHPLAMPRPALGLSEPGSLSERIQRLLAPGERPRLRLSWKGFAGTILLLAALLYGLEHATSWSVTYAKHLLTAQERIAAVAEVAKADEPEDYGDPTAKFVLAGSIQTEEGAAPTQPVFIQSMSRRVSGSVSSSSSGLSGKADRTFNVTIPPGQCWLVFNTEGFAPALAGPFAGKGGETRDGIDVVLKRGRPGLIRVVDQQGQPVAGAKVNGSPDWGGFSIGTPLSLTTDEKGLAQAEHLADVPYQFSVQAVGFSSLENMAPKRIGAEPLAIVLEPARTTTGIVVDAAGNSVGGAEFHILIARRGNFSHSPGEDPKPLAVTHDDGTFELSNLATDFEYDLLIDAGERGHAGLARVRAGTKNLRVLLQKKLTVAGQVRGDLQSLGTTQPAPIFIFSGQTQRIQKSRNVRLDVEGRFRFYGVFAGPYQLSVGSHVIQGKLEVSVTDLVIDLAELEKAQGTREVEARFVENGRAVAPEGTIRSQMEVVDERNQLRFGEALPIVEGAVRFRVKTPGSMRLVAEGCLGYWFKDFAGEVAPGADPFRVDIPVRAAGAIRVKVVSPNDREAQTGAAQYTASVQFKFADATAGGQVHLISFSRNSNPPHDVVLSPVPLDTPCLVSVTEGYRKAYAPVMHLEVSQPVRELSLQLPAAIDVPLRVESMEGTPLREIPIEIAFEPVSNPSTQGGDGLSPGSHSWMDDRPTDRLGMKLLPRMPARATGYSVIAQPKRDWQFAKAAVRTDGGTMVLKLERGKVTEGRVVDRKTGQPVPGIEVHARPTNVQLGGLREFIAEEPTDAEGRFRFSNLPPQKVKLTAWGTRQATQPEIEPGRPELVTLEVEVP